ncbi:MAG TPA: tyrosine-type recombinase/integrase [Candidatus Angelobacter sp.]|nr:tyrosine-type recombinase/integrase [Candidatus Angelobacter sp.]
MLIATRAARRKPATFAIRYRSVRQFFPWAFEEGMIKSSPMATMRPPRITETPPDVLRDEELTRLLKVVEADRTIAGRRDAAVVRLFIASGARLSEISNLRWTPRQPTTNDVDLDGSLIRVVGKGNQERPIYVGARVAKALDRYIYDHRAKHRLADSPWLWRATRSPDRLGDRPADPQRTSTRLGSWATRCLRVRGSSQVPPARISPTSIFAMTPSSGGCAGAAPGFEPGVSRRCQGVFLRRRRARRGPRPGRADARRGRRRSP